MFNFCVLCREANLNETLHTKGYCRFGPILIGVFMNMILYGVRRIIPVYSVLAYCSALGVNSSGRCNNYA
jgi:hypothetical protein